jgi:hypothetical protein
VFAKSEKLKDLENYGPFAVEFVQEMKYLVYNYEEEKFYEWEIED